MERIAIYPGSYDPITKGELDIISRISRIFDKLYVVVLSNDTKHSLFTVKERVAMLKEITKDFPNVEADSYKGLVVDYAEKVGAIVNIRGLMAVSDFEYEMQNNSMNRFLNHGIETMFIMTRSENTFLSSCTVKETAKSGTDIVKLVPKVVEIALKKKLTFNHQVQYP